MISLRVSRWLLGTACVFITSQVFAQSEASVPSLGQMLLQVFGALILITSLIIGAAWIAKRFNVLQVSSNNELKAIASLNLGRKEKAVMVKARGKTLLLGVGSGSVSLLCDLSDDVAEDASQKIDTSDTQNTTHTSEVIDQLGLDEKAKPEFSSFLKNILHVRRDHSA